MKVWVSRTGSSYDISRDSGEYEIDLPEVLVKDIDDNWRDSVYWQDLLKVIYEDAK